MAQTARREGHVRRTARDAGGAAARAAWISPAHASDAIILFSDWMAAPLSSKIMPERVITIALSDAEWKLLQSIQPEPVDWIKRTIRERIEKAQQAPSVERAQAASRAH
jgi:hypothetical protein